MDAPRKHPRILHAKRFARNGSVPDASFTREIISAQNHIMRYRRKVLFRSGSVFTTGDSHASFMTTARWRSHLGYAATRVKFLLLFGADVANGATDPRVTISATIAGGATTSTVVRCGQIMDSGVGVKNAPSLIAVRRASIEVQPNTTYEFSVSRTDSYVRPLSILAYEESDPDFSQDYYHQNQTGVNGAIVDSTRQRTLEGLSNTWRRNGAQLLNWCDADTSLASTFTSTTWVNVLNPLLSTVTSSSPGFFLGDEDFRLGRMCRLSSNGELNCVIAAYGSMSAGSTGEVRLESASGTVCSISGISTTPQWYFGPVNLQDVGTLDKVDLQARTSNAANTLTLHAFSLYTYLA